jgi:hypothetical protein
MRDVSPSSIPSDWLGKVHVAATCLKHAVCTQAAASAAGVNLSAFGVDINTCNVPAGSSIGGAYLQASSQFPDKGPCYPVWAPTVPYFNR